MLRAPLPRLKIPALLAFRERLYSPQQRIAVDSAFEDHPLAASAEFVYKVSAYFGALNTARTCQVGQGIHLECWLTAITTPKAPLRWRLWRIGVERERESSLLATY